MHKSIFGRMFWTYAIILLVVFSTIAVAMSVFFSRFNTRKQIETMVSVAHTVEYWAGALQIEQTDARSTDTLLMVKIHAFRYYGSKPRRRGV